MSNQLQVSGAAKIRTIQGPVVANSGVITALDGDASQYVRGDGTLADFPTSTGGGSSVSYYLNTSVSQGTIGGVAYKQLSKVPISGAGTDVSTSANGYIASYITDANDPALLEVPAGNFNCEFYFSVNSNAHNPYVYAELYKYDGTTFTLLGSNQAIPEYLTNGTTLSAYYFAIPVATAVLTITDRIAVRIYVNVDGRTVTLHTENNHLCQVVTTFSKGLTTLNSLTRQVQFFQTGTSGTDFAISSSVATHTFNLPVASASNTGKLSSTDWSTFNGKVPYTGANANVDLGIYNLTAAGVTANSFNAIGSGVQGGYLYLKKGSSPFNVLVGSNSITAEDSKFILMSDAGSSNYKLANIDIGLLTNNTARTFTLPDISGTLALLEGSQTFSGSKTFSSSIKADSGILLKNGFTIYSNGYTSLGGDTGNLIISSSISGTPYDNEFSFTPSTSNTYTFPNSTGTIALTSNLSSYVPYTGATQGVNLGGFGLTVTGISNAAGMAMSQSGTTYPSSGYSAINGVANGLNVKVGISYSYDLLFPAANYNYTFPSATGTIALTSDLGAYVTLATAQDISGNKTFTALATKVEALGIKLTSGVVSTTGYLTLNTKVVGTLHSLILSPDSATNIAEFTFDNSAIRTYALQNASGTIALLSGTQTFTGATTFSSNITVNSVQVGSAGNTTNIKLGDSTFGAITTGSNNIAIGSSALTSITTSNANIGIGNSALASVVDGAFNTAIGFGIGGSITSGSNNALFGYGAGSAITTGNYNTILGAYAGTAGMSNNIVLADGAGNIRYQWNGTNNVFGNSISGTSATFSSSVTANGAINARAGGYLALYDISTNTNRWDIYTNSDNSYRMNYNGSGNDELVITSAGIVGIGITPNTWAGTNTKALQVYLGSMASSLTFGTAFTFNSYYDGSWRYTGSFSAGKYEIGGNEHIWYSAPDGTAGNAITFTERMRITSGGYLKASNNGSYENISANYHELRNTSSDTVVRCTATNGSYTSTVVAASADRAASADYSLYGGWSGNFADKEFNLRGDGNAYADGAWIPGGADYAEYFEWIDGNQNNEDRRGYSVSLIDNKIKIAEQGEAIIGVISGNPSIVADAAWNKWSGKYLKDDFGSYILDEDGNRTLNPDYDKNAEYIPREQRPEWGVVGLVGKLSVRKGQVTMPNWIKMKDISDNVEQWLIK